MMREAERGDGNGREEKSFEKRRKEEEKKERGRKDERKVREERRKKEGEERMEGRKMKVKKERRNETVSLLLLLNHFLNQVRLETYSRMIPF